MVRPKRMRSQSRLSMPTTHLDQMFGPASCQRCRPLGHHLVDEVQSEEDPGSITLGVNQETVQSAPTFPDPHVGPDEECQRAIREHYGYG